MNNRIWALRNGFAKMRFIVETFGVKALLGTLGRKLREKLEAAPPLPPARPGFALFPVPDTAPRLTVILEGLETVPPEVGEAITLCQGEKRSLRIVTRSSPARTDVFGAYIKASHPAFRANVDFAFVDRANPYAELPISGADLFWPNDTARAEIPAHLILERAEHVSL
jgi:hypothetical protein